MKKTDRFVKIFVIVFLGMFFVISTIVISTILIKQSVEKNTDYYKYKDEAVSVSAIVSKVYVSEDQDNNKSYKTHIDYKYGNKKYSNIYWDTFSSKKVVGQKVIIKILPDNPTHIFEDDIGAGDLNGATYMFCVIMGFLFFCLYETWENKNEDISKVIDADKIFLETKPKLTIMMIFLSIAFARILLIYMYPWFVNYDNSPLSTSIVIVVSIVLFAYKLVKCISYSFNNYCLISERCTDKDTDSDSDGNTTYNLFFGNKKFSYAGDLFHKIQIGDVFWLLLNKKGKILEVYDAKNWTKDLYTSDDYLYRKKCIKNLGIRVITSLITAIIFVAYFSVILHIMQ